MKIHTFRKRRICYLNVVTLVVLLAACGQAENSATFTGSPSESAALSAKTSSAITAAAGTSPIPEITGTSGTTSSAPTQSIPSPDFSPTPAFTNAANPTVLPSARGLTTFQAALTKNAQTPSAPTPTFNPDFGPTIPPTFTPAPTSVPQPPARGWWSNGVCYEVFVRSFFDSNGDGIGDINGLTSKLDYIKNLGANCIWLMPITASPSYHGYNTTDFYLVNKDYGTNDDFKQFIKEAHARGINVIIDLMLNHTADTHPWFLEAQDQKNPRHDWYVWSPTEPKYLNPWGEKAWWPIAGNYYYGVFGKDLPDLNYRNPAVTQEMYKVTRFWLQEMGVDGFRIDAAKHLIEDRQAQIDTPETKAWLRDYRLFYKGVRPDAFAVGEVNGQQEELQGFWPDQLDSYFEFGLADGMVSSLVTNNPAKFLTALNYAEQNWPYQRWSSFLTNHDQDRIMSRLGGDKAKMKLAATLLLTVPGLPFIYYGEEIGQQGFKPDEKIRTPMQWENNATAGFTTGKPWEAPDPSVTGANVRIQESDPNSLLNFYRKLIKLRRSSTALSEGGWLPLKSDKTNAAAYLRFSSGETDLVILNFGTGKIENAVFSLDKSELKPGQYTGLELIQNISASTLNVEPGGRISGAVPLPALEAVTGYIIRLALK